MWNFKDVNKNNSKLAISAEHGIGKLKIKYLREMLGAKSILQMAVLKKSLAPKMILNIGNIFEEKF